MCGNCDATNKCEYDENSRINVPQTLYLRPINDDCKNLFVKYNTQGGGKNACGPYKLNPDIDGSTKPFGKQYAFIVTPGVGEPATTGFSSCKNNVKLNPDIMGKNMQMQVQQVHLHLLLDKHSFLTKIVLLFIFFQWLVLVTAMRLPTPTLTTFPSTHLAPSDSNTDKSFPLTLMQR